MSGAKHKNKHSCAHVLQFPACVLHFPGKFICLFCRVILIWHGSEEVWKVVCFAVNFSVAKESVSKENQDSQFF